MPQVPAYIRNADWDAYMKIRASGKNAWAEHIHNSLNPVEIAVKELFDQGLKTEELPIIKTPEDIPELSAKPITKAFSARKKK